MKSRGLITRVGALLALCLMLVVPTAAFAAVTAGGPIDVQIWPQDGQTIVIASVELPAGTSLPAVVRIPVVPGATVEWAGEIIGTDSSGDIAAPFKLVNGQGGQYAEFTLTKSLRGQIDTVESTLTVSGTIVSASVDWVQSVSSTQTTFSVRVPTAVSDVSITPSPVGKPVANGLGESLYLLPDAELNPGEKQTVTLTYNTVPSPPDSSTPSADSIIIALVVGLLVAVIVLVLVLRRRSA